MLERKIDRVLIFYVNSVHILWVIMHILWPIMHILGAIEHFMMVQLTSIRN